MRRSIWMSGIVAAVCGAVLLAGFSAPERSEALSPNEWDPGYIISDAIFYDTTSLTASGIQSFLNGRGGMCRTGFTCLRDFRQDTVTKPAQTQLAGHCSAYQGQVNETAASIIYKAAMACRINPQVLLVLLQKEQGLVTATAPTATTYARATGFGCPDTAPCNPAYATFEDQVYSAAWQFRQYTLTPARWNYRVGSSYVGYNPNGACGGSYINIRNQATANLYIYTPYQPNAATISWKLGGGPAVSSAYPGCGAFGNINFATIFSEWFGSPIGLRHGSFDSATGTYGGVRITGWSVDPTQAGQSYLWVNVDGTGGPYVADAPLPWFDALYPGYGPNHGFDIVVPAEPGVREVCVYGSVSLLSCKTVTIPRGVGSLDTVRAMPGGIQIDGWSVDFTTTEPSPIWVNVDGSGGSQLASQPLPWIDGYFPGIGENHGFSIRIPAGLGPHQVCVYGVEALLGCQTVTVTRTDDGAFDAVTSQAGAIRIQGWSVDLTKPGPSYVWVNVNGVGQAYVADATIPWFEAIYPGAGLNHGFDISIPAPTGRAQVCVYGTSRLLNCRTIDHVRSAGAVDSVAPAPGSITVSGWSVDLRSTDPAYIWINVDSSGGPALADRELPWFEAAYPGSGLRHGYQVTVPATPGAHQVCVYGSETLLGCRIVTVPAS